METEDTVTFSKQVKRRDHDSIELRTFTSTLSDHKGIVGTGTGPTKEALLTYKDGGLSNEGKKERERERRKGNPSDHLRI